MAENVGAIQGGNQPVTVYDNGGTYSLSPTNAALYGAGSRMPALMAARAKALSGAAGSAGNADVYGSGGTGSGDYNAQGGHAGRLNGWPTAPQALGGTLASTLEAQSQGTPYEGFLSNLYNQFQQPQGFMYGGSPAYAQNTAAAERTQAGQYQQQFGDLGAQAAGVGAYAQRLGQNAQAGLEGSANSLYDYAQQASGYGSTLANRTNPTANYLSQNAALDQASGYGTALANLEQGNEPSGAQALLQQGANQSMDQALALSRSGRGWGGSAQGTAQALRQNAATMQNVGLQASQLRAQEYAAQQQRMAANLGAAAGINQNAAGQYGQQSQFDVNAALQGRQLNDQSGLAYNQLGLNAAQQSLAAQQAAYNFGMQGAQGLQQAITQQGQLGQAGQAAYWQGEQGADTAMARQQQALESYNQAIMQRYGVDKGVAIQNQAAQAQLTGSLAGAGGALLGGLVGAFAGGPAGAVGGAGLGYTAGQSVAGGAMGAGQQAAQVSDVRAKRDIAPAGGVADQLATVPSYSYQYVDPERFGRGPQVGVMAQDLERTPAGSTVVRPARDGTKMVDAGKTTMLNTAAIGELARRVQQLEGGQAETQYDYGAPYVTSDVRSKELIRPLADGAEEAPMKFTLSPARAGYHALPVAEAHQPRRPMTTAERLDALDALSAPENTRAIPPSDAGRAFSRAAITSGLDAAAEPVRLAGQALEAAGYPNSAAHLRGQDAAEAIDYLTRGVDPAQYRAELAADAAEHPYFQQAGDIVGGSLGGAPMAALTGRLNPGVGTVLNAARRSGRDAARQKQAIERLGTRANELYERRPAYADETIAFLREHPEFADKTDQAAQFFANHPDREAIERMGHSSEYMNRYLRERAQGKRDIAYDLEERKRLTARGLNDAAAQGHGYEGESYRGLHLPKEVLDDWLNRGAVRNEGFWASSANPEYLEAAPSPGFGTEQAVGIRMRGRTGVPIGGVSEMPHEQEVLTAPGRNWLIRGQSKDANGRHILDLEETPNLPEGMVPAIGFSGGGTTGAPSAAMTAAMLDALRKENTRRKEKR